MAGKFQSASATVLRRARTLETMRLSCPDPRQIHGLERAHRGQLAHLSNQLRMNAVLAPVATPDFTQAYNHTCLAAHTITRSLAVMPLLGVMNSHPSLCQTRDSYTWFVLLLESRA
jgi:hypothetical protein